MRRLWFSYQWSHLHQGLLHLSDSVKISTFVSMDVLSMSFCFGVTDVVILLFYLFLKLISTVGTGIADPHVSQCRPFI